MERHKSIDDAFASSALDAVLAHQSHANRINVWAEQAMAAWTQEFLHQSRCHPQTHVPSNCAAMSDVADLVSKFVT